MNSKPKCVVLSCLGGAQGELGVVRSLGRRGVHVVLVSEYHNPIARYSKYTREFLEISGIFREQQKTLDALIEYAAKQDTRPVLFPTADPDLEFISAFREQLEPHYLLFVSRRDIVENFMDKAKFFRFALEHGYPIPDTHIPAGPDDVAELCKVIRFPAILKPMMPKSWGKEAIRRIVDSKKALKVDSGEELIRYYREISAHDSDLVIQEYIPGRDDRLYSLHAYLDRQGKPLGYFVGRKIRTFPTYAGIGCHVISVDLPEIIRVGLDILSKAGYTGLALLQFKHDPTTGEYKLLEINPRASSWNQLATECGVNLPYLAYADTAGLPAEPQLRQADGVKYFYFEHDLHAFIDYRKHGDCTLRDWLASYRGKKVFQFYATDDLKPYLIETRSFAARALARITRPLRR